MLNKTQLIGRLGNDPEQRATGNGTAVTKFRMATTESYRDKEGKKVETTEWHNIVIFGKLAEIAGQYLKKGSLVYIEGKNKTRKWDKDGQTHYTTEIEASEMQMMPSGSGRDGDDQRAPQGATQGQQRPSSNGSSYEKPKPKVQSAPQYDGPF